MISCVTIQPFGQADSNDVRHRRLHADLKKPLRPVSIHALNQSLGQPNLHGNATAAGSLFIRCLSTESSQIISEKLTKRS